MRVLPDPFDALRREAGLGTPTVMLGILAASLVPGLLGAAETIAFWRMAGQSVEVWRAFALQLPQWAAYGLITPLILRFGQAVPIRRARWLGPAAAHVGLALLLGTVHAAVAAAASVAFSPFPSAGYAQTALRWYLGGLPVTLLAYFVVLGSGWAVYWFARHRSGEVKAARLEAQLSQGRLSALRMQLNPHFLFNSLNAVTVLVRDREWEPAERAIHLLAELLRATLRTGGPDQIPLREEVEFTTRYLELEGLRFSDRLRIRCEAPRELDSALVPVFVLQPLVENALRHGIEPKGAAGLLSIIASADGDALRLEVEDDGAGLDAPPTNAGAGVGLRNLRERLAVLFGERATLVLHRREGGGTRAIVSIPLEFEEDVHVDPA